MNRIKTAVVGVGGLGRHHLRWLSQIPNSELVGCFDIDQEKSKKHASEYNVTAFESLEQLAGKAQAASVVVPTSAHYEVASFLMDKGVHCLIEKPITVKLEDAYRLQKLARDRGVTVTVGQIERFNPAITGLAGQDIRPSFIEAHRLAAFDPRGTDVAVVLDLMIHDIDLCLMLIKSNVADIRASVVSVISEQTDIANARLTFENGTVANLTASRISLNAMRKLRIFQQSGYYSLDLAKKQADIYRLADGTNDGQGMRFPLGKSDREILYLKKADTGEDMLGAELKAFLDAVAGEREVAVTIEDGTEALRVALEVERIGRESLTGMLKTEPV